MDSIIPFGKHCGLNIFDVIKRDRGYCRWLAARGIFTEESFIGQFLRREFDLERCACGVGFLLHHKCNKR